MDSSVRTPNVDYMEHDLYGISLIQASNRRVAMSRLAWHVHLAYMSHSLLALRHSRSPTRLAILRIRVAAAHSQRVTQGLF